ADGTATSNNRTPLKTEPKPAEQTSGGQCSAYVVDCHGRRGVTVNKRRSSPLLAKVAGASKNVGTGLASAACIDCRRDINGTEEGDYHADVAAALARSGRKTAWSPG